MADITKEFTLVAVKEETTEGVFAEPTDADYFETLEDGVTITKTRETKERNVLSGDRMRQDLRLSRRDVETEVPTEMKSGETEGAAPKYQPFLHAFGFKNRGLATAVTSGEDHTVNKLYIENADLSKFKKNDIILVKEAGAYHTTPILSIGNDGGGDYIVPLVPFASAPSDNVLIAASQNLVLDKTQLKTLSLKKVFEGHRVVDNISGLRTQSIQLQNWTTGDYASWIFSMVGLDYQEKVEASPLNITPDFGNSNPALILSACIYKNGVRITANEFTMSMEQNISFKTSTCAENGKISSRPTGKYNITGTINPYKEQYTIDWTLDESEFSIFVRAFNPADTDGEIKEVAAVFLPLCKATAIEVADVEGLMADQVTFKLVPNSETDSPTIFFS